MIDVFCLTILNFLNGCVHKNRSHLVYIHFMIGLSDLVMNVDSKCPNGSQIQ